MTEEHQKMVAVGVAGVVVCVFFEVLDSLVIDEIVVVVELVVVKVVVQVVIEIDEVVWVGVSLEVAAMATSLAVAIVAELVVVQKGQPSEHLQI